MALSRLSAAGVVGGVARGAEEPASEHGGVADRPRLARQDQEDRLLDVVGPMWVARLPQRRGIDRVDVPPNKLGERVGRAGGDVGGNELAVGHTRISTIMPP